MAEVATEATLPADPSAGMAFAPKVWIAWAAVFGLAYAAAGLLWLSSSTPARAIGAAAAAAGMLLAARVWRQRPRAAVLALLAGAGTLIVALLGLLGGAPMLAGVAPDQTPMSPEGVLCMALLLAGCTAAETGRTRLGAALCVAAAILALASLMAWFHIAPRTAAPPAAGLAWWFGERMQPLHALPPFGAALAGLLRCMPAYRARTEVLAWMLGVSTLLAAAISLIASHLGTQEATVHLSYPPASVPGALALTAISLWLVLSDRPLRTGAAWLPLLAALVLTAGAMRLAWYVDLDQLQQKQREAETAADAATAAIRNAFATRLASIDRFAQRLLAVSPPERMRLFEVEAQQALRANDGMQSVALVDQQRIVRQISALNLSTRLVGRSALFDERRADAYRRAEATGKAVALGPLLLTGTDIEAMLVIYPAQLGASGETEFIVAGYRLSEILALALDGVAPGFALQATINGQARDLRGTPQSDPHWQAAGRSEFRAIDASWTVAVAPDGSRPRQGLPVSRAVGSAGVLVAVLVALALRLAATARERADTAERAFVALRVEAAARASSEAALARSEQQAQRLLENMPDAVLTLDREFKIMFANRGARELVSAHVGDPVGRTMGALFPNFPGSAFERGFRKVIDERRSVTMEGYSSTVGRWLSARAHPVDSGVTAIFDDITEVRRAEAFEREQREVLRAIAANHPLGECIDGAIRLFESRFPGTAAAVLRLDTATRCVDAVIAPNLPGDTFKALLGSPLPDDAGCCGPAAAAGASASTLSIADDLRWQGRAGALIDAGFCACWSQALLDAGGAVIGTFSAYLRESRTANAMEAAAAQSVAALVRIAIERDLAAMRVETERQRFRSLSERSPYMVFAFDVGRRLVDCNENAARQSGFQRVQLLGTTAEALVLAPWRDKVRQCFDAALRGESSRIDCAVMTAARVRRDAEVTVIPIAVDGRIAGVFGVMRDTTDERRIAGELDRALRDLTARNRELQDFAYVASHDLQEPLRKVQAFSDRVVTRFADGLDPQAVDYLKRIDAAAHRMQILIDDLLAYSRVTSQGQPFAPVDLGEVLDDVLSDLEVRIEDTGAVIERSPLPLIDGDRTQLRQLLQNLVANALKFRDPARAPRIRIEALTPAATPGTVQLVIEDNGIGFDPAYAERIFAPFQRLHGRHEYEGTGIGLAVVRRIVERHHGGIVAIGRPGKGARFEVTLPLRTA